MENNKVDFSSASKLEWLSVKVSVQPAWSGGLFTLSIDFRPVVVHLSWEILLWWERLLKKPGFWAPSLFVSLMKSFGAGRYNLFIRLEGNKLQDSKRLCPGIVKLHDTGAVWLIRIISQIRREAQLEIQLNWRRAAESYGNCSFVLE